MASVERFKGTFSEMARPNRYVVRGFGLPAELEFHARSASLPSATIGVAEAWHGGRATKLGGDRVYPDWTITVYQSHQASIYREFELWQELVLLHEQNVGSPNKADYKRDGQVWQLGRDDSLIVGFNIVGAVPIELGALELAADSNDTPAEFTVTLAYDYFVMV